MGKQLEIVSAEYLEAYTARCQAEELHHFQAFNPKTEFTAEDFEYYLIASSLYSSKIEGNTLDANSFFRNRDKVDTPRKKEVQEIEDLVAAYRFASENALTRSNFMKTHAMLSQTFLPASERGCIRKEQVGVRDSATLRPVYLAVEPEYVDQELGKLFGDVDELLQRDLSATEVLYYASILHLWLAKIHPFMDGNGRSARLLEKWFLASKLGKAAWSVNSEKYYWDHRPAYYQNIALGFNYYALHWERCIPFLLMLPTAMAARE